MGKVEQLNDAILVNSHSGITDTRFNRLRPTRLRGIPTLNCEVNEFDRKKNRHVPFYPKTDYITKLSPWKRQKSRNRTPVRKVLIFFAIIRFFCHNPIFALCEMLVWLSHTHTMHTHRQQNTSNSSLCKYFLVFGSFVVPFVLPLKRKGRKLDYGKNIRSVCWVFLGIIEILSKRQLYKLTGK